MKSVLTTKPEAYQRFLSLMDGYTASHKKIESLSDNIKNYMEAIEKQLEAGEDFDEQALKLLLGNLNSEQTSLVNTLKKMNELHAKMGYLV